MLVLLYSIDEMELLSLFLVLVFVLSQVLLGREGSFVSTVFVRATDRHYSI
jgi:hypothetical protein